MNCLQYNNNICHTGCYNNSEIGLPAGRDVPLLRRRKTWTTIRTAAVRATEGTKPDPEEAVAQTAERANIVKVRETNAGARKGTGILRTDTVRAQAEAAILRMDTVRAQAEAAVRRMGIVRAQAEAAALRMGIVRAQAEAAVRRTDIVRAQAEAAARRTDTVRARGQAGPQVEQHLRALRVHTAAEAAIQAVIAARRRRKRKDGIVSIFSRGSFLCSP